MWAVSFNNLYITSLCLQPVAIMREIEKINKTIGDRKEKKMGNWVRDGKKGGEQSWGMEVCVLVVLRESPCLFSIRGKVHRHPVPSSSMTLLTEWKNPITLQTASAASNDTPAWPITSLTADPLWQVPTLCVFETINRPASRTAYLEMIRYHCVRRQGLIG